MSSARDAIARAAAILESGGLVAFPTETVYGLGADASNAAAVAKIFSLKGRPQDHPVIVHLPDAGALPLWAREIPEPARRLADKFWPGPLTLILKRAAGVADCVTGGQDTVGLRVPGHPLALALLNAFGKGVAAPSANRFGRISPTTAQHVRDEFPDGVDLILDGGDCGIGIESTIVDLSRGRPVLLRPGHITSQSISAVLGCAVAMPDGGAPRVSGALENHYAPRTPLYLVATAELQTKIAGRRGERLAVLARTGEPAGTEGVIWELAPRTPAAYARALYAALRRLDTKGCTAILVEAPPATARWQGVADRLRRASAK
jgi:L-threonylcarbamoyladenylate synthase